jgi:uncharacterized membrane protein YqjE
MTVTDDHHAPVGPAGTGPNGHTAADADLARLFGELREEGRILLSSELELAKAELDEAKRHLVTGAVGYAAAAVLGLLAVVLLSVAAAWGLAEAVPTWLGFLIVGGAWAVFALVAVGVARRAFRRFDPVPRRTIQTLKEDARWAKTQIS